jgi:hypothetical protein
LDRNDLPGACVDTTGHSVADVLRLVRERTGGWPDLPEPTGAPIVGEAPDQSIPFGGSVASSDEILWLCGATAVGKSTVGWQVYQQVRRAGIHSAFVDLDQIGFHRPVSTNDPGNHRLKAANLAAIWQTYRANGSRCLIVVGPVESPDAVRTYTAALPAATITLCRLHAGRDQLAERIMLRGQGLGSTWGMPGDELRGLSGALLRQAADDASADAEALENAAIGDLRIDTDGRPAQDIALEILIRTSVTPSCSWICQDFRDW